MHKHPKRVDFGVYAYSYIHFIVTEKETAVNEKFNSLKIRAQFLH